MLCNFAGWWGVLSWLEAFLQIAKSDKLPSRINWNSHLLKCVPHLQFEDKINYCEICTNVCWELATPWVKDSLLSLMTVFSRREELGGNLKGFLYLVKHLKWKIKNITLRIIFKISNVVPYDYWALAAGIWMLAVLVPLFSDTAYCSNALKKNLGSGFIVWLNASFIRAFKRGKWTEIYWNGSTKLL